MRGLTGFFALSILCSVSLQIASAGLLRHKAEQDRSPAWPGHFHRRQLLSSSDIVVTSNVTLEYSVQERSGGLINQHWGHTDAVMLAIKLHIKALKWPPALSRSSFTMEGAKWSYTPAEGLYDIPKIRTFFKDHFGLHISTVAAKGYVPIEGSRFYLCDWDGTPMEDKFIWLHMSLYHGRHAHETVLQLFKTRLAELRTLYPDLADRPVLIRLDNTFDMLGTVPHDVASTVMRNLNFSQQLQGLANDVVSAITKAGERSDAQFNAVHLRLENDFLWWHRQAGGEDAFWKMYEDGMRQVGFSSANPLYVASGLIKEAARDPKELARFMKYVSKIQCGQLASQVVFKELFMSEATRTNLPSESAAAVDFLVMRQSHKMVGTNMSTFSLALATMRDLDGREADNTLVIHMPKPDIFANIQPMMGAYNDVKGSLKGATRLVRRRLYGLHRQLSSLS